MWYFSWILGVLLACSLGIINVLRLEAQEALAKEQEAIDPLTRFLARESILTRLREKVDNSKRNGLPFSIIYLSIRDFRHKHQLPDHEIDTTLLKSSPVIQQDIRVGVDLIGRVNDDDFILALPGASMEKAQSIAEKIQHNLIETIKTPSGLPLEITIGVAEYSQHQQAFDEDQLLGLEEVEALLNIAISRSFETDNA
jgi:cyd operon protein YbgT